MMPKIGQKVKPRLGPKPSGIKNAREVHIITEVKELIIDSSEGMCSQIDIDNEGGYWIKTDKLHEWYSWIWFRNN